MGKIIGIDLGKTGIKGQNGAEESYGYGGYHDSPGPVAQPYNKDRSQSRLGQAVEHNQERLYDFKQGFVGPEQQGRPKAYDNDQKKAEQCFP